MTGKIVINQELCKGCTLCVEFCPRDLIIPTMKLNAKGYYVVSFEPGDGQCTACTMCATICPEVAIEVYRE